MCRIPTTVACGSDHAQRDAANLPDSNGAGGLTSTRAVSTPIRAARPPEATLVGIWQRMRVQGARGGLAPGLPRSGDGADAGREQPDDVGLPTRASPQTRTGFIASARSSAHSAARSSSPASSSGAIVTRKLPGVPMTLAPSAARRLAIWSAAEPDRRRGQSRRVSNAAAARPIAQWMSIRPRYSRISGVMP